MNNEDGLNIKDNIANQRRSELIFIAKRLKDVICDLEALKDDEKMFVVERIESKNSGALTELYNMLGEYMK